MAAGDGALNAGYAVTYEPDHGEKMKLNAYFQEQHQRQLDREAKKAEDAAAHKFALEKYYGDQFDPSKFDSKTALDESINGYLTKGHQSVSDAIQAGVDGADLQKIMGEAITPALQLYQKGSLIKANIDKTALALKDDKGLDVDALSKEATLRALYKRDANGKYVLKNTEELKQVDPEHDYSKEILDEMPELVSKAGVDVEGKFAKMLPGSFKSSGSYYSSPGVKRKGSFDATWFQGAQKLDQDAEGNYKVVTADNPIKTKDANGNELIIHQVPDEVLSHFSGTVGERAALDVATKKYARENGYPEVKQGTQAFEQMKKAMLYDKIEHIGPKRISEGQDVTKSNSLTRIELGYPMTGASQGPIQQEAPSFNKITDSKLYFPVMGKNIIVGDIKEGKVTGNIPMGKSEAKIKIEDLPVEYQSAAGKLDAKNDITGDREDNRKKTPTGFVTVELFDKVITGIKTDKGNFFTIPNLGQLWEKENNTTVPMKVKTHPHEASTKQKISW